MKDSTRLLAVKALRHWEESGMTADAALDALPRGRSGPGGADGRLLKHLYYGVLRQRDYLDHHISRLTGKPVDKIDLVPRQGLRVGLYQILFMDRIPERAAVHETVEALKALRAPPWIVGFANGVLRGAVREGLRSRKDVFEAAMTEAERLGHPEWLLRRWRERHGGDGAQRLCQANNTQPRLTLNVHPGKISREAFIALLREKDFDAEMGSTAPTAVHLPRFRGEIADIPGYREGFFLVQDEAAQLVSHLLHPFPKGIYLDGCAGLGGKTSHLAWLLPPGSRIVAIEPAELRVRLLHENLGRLGLGDRVEVRRTSLEAYHDEAFAPSFSGAIIDAPCSGLGVIRRHPDIRWNRVEADLKKYRERQIAFLDGAADLLAPGAILVYAVCSLEPEENEEVVEAFLAKRSNFVLADCREGLPEAAKRYVDGRGLFRTTPHLDDLDGFFAARFMKEV